MNGQLRYYFSINCDKKRGLNDNIMKKILVIDDETITIQIIKFTLEENKNFEIETATDGSKAIEYLENNVPDLIISDLVMPFKTGVDVVSYVNQKYPNVPIIIISSLASNHTNVLEVKKLNISYFISKPLDSEVLNNCVNELLENKKIEIINSIEDKTDINPVLNIASKNKKTKNDKIAEEKYIKLKNNIMEKSRNKEIELDNIKDNSSETQQTEKDLLDTKKYEKKVKKIKTKIKDNKNEGKKVIKKLKSKLFKEEFDENSTKKMLKKIQKISSLHFELINELEELEE